MKVRIKCYQWNETSYYQFPDGRVCRVDPLDAYMTLQEIYDYLQVPFLFY